MVGTRIYLNPDGTVYAVVSNGQEVRAAPVGRSDQGEPPAGYAWAVRDLQALRQRYRMLALGAGGSRNVPWSQCLRYHDEANAKLKAAAFQFLEQYGVQRLQLRVEHRLQSFLAAGASDTGDLTAGAPCGGDLWANRVTVTPQGQVRLLATACHPVLNHAEAEALAGFWRRLNDDVLEVKGAKRELFK